ncbi:uncharacterized protein ARMOST_02030 [Armillaria ostoyae]|uniref:Uncharacterized protein n=1 Tax=Armillaria ostoyae TaxID=47428 RepID=A0A284QQT6_ARMOS|nr:uncharacterized protein ARMOST_02030 [Armillaria ostoyae]
MSDVQIYLKPRPIPAIYGYANYLPLRWDPNFEYGPFYANYGTIPSDAAEVYTIQSLDLSAGIALFHMLMFCLPAKSLMSFETQEEGSRFPNKYSGDSETNKTVTPSFQLLRRNPSTAPDDTYLAWRGQSVLLGYQLLHTTPTRPGD